VHRVEEELSEHLELLTEEYLSSGLPPDEARRRARVKLGARDATSEAYRDELRLRGLEDLGKDVRYGLRTLRRNPGFAVAGILSLALGIGANTAIFQLLDAVRLRTLPVHRPDQLAEIRFPPGTSRWGSFSSRRAMLTSIQFEEIRSRQRIFTDVFAWSSGPLNTASGGEVDYVEALWASGNLFDVLGVKPTIGRLLSPSDDVAGCGAPRAVISHAYWQRAFAGSPAVLGQTVRLEGRHFDIVGVAPPEFFGIEVGRRFDVAVPLCADSWLSREDRALSRRAWWLSAIGRLPEGRSAGQATDQLVAISPAIMRATLPPCNTLEGDATYLAGKLNAFPVDAGVSTLREQFAQPLVVLLAATALVLLIACANLANLLLARASARGRDIAVHLAVGASRARIVRQLLVESLLLAAIGTVLGVAVASALNRVLLAQIAASMDSLFLDLRWNVQVLSFNAAVTVIACLLFGVGPALKATAIAPTVSLRSGGRSMTDGRERFGLRRALVVAQVALSLVLLVGTLLFSRTLYNLLALDAGLDQRIVVVNLADASLMTDDPARGLALRERLRERIAALPDVAGAALVEYVPLAGNLWNEYVFADRGDGKALSNFTRVSANYFELLGIPILRGRTFDDHAGRSAPAVAVVNEAFVEKLLPDVDPLGRLLWIETAPGEPLKKIEIVGVARNTKYRDIREDFQPLVHLAMFQADEMRDIARLAVKPRTGVDRLLSTIPRAVAEVDPAIDIELSVLNQTVSGRLVRERLMAALSLAFGALAGLLAAIGLYGVMSYTVTRRSHELGIRLAMGATGPQIRRMVVSDAGRLLVAGVAVGASLSALAAHAARSLLFGLQPTDPATIASAVALLAAIGFAAAYVPARRASNLDPLAVIRNE
jgi:predicted permease